MAPAVAVARRRPRQQVQQPSGWAALPSDLLLHVFGLLQPQRAAPCTVKEAGQLVARLSVCRHWREAAARALRLPLRCGLGEGEEAGLASLLSRGLRCEHLWLVGAQPLENFRPRMSAGWDMPDCTGLEGPGFWEQVAPRLQLLGGLPAGVPGWPWRLLRGGCRRLRALHLHLPLGRPKLAVGGAAWASLEALEELAITAGPYSILTLNAPLPPALRRLYCTAEHLYGDLPLLLRVRCASLAAREVYAVANTPENNEDVHADVHDLAELAAAAAAARMPPGHYAEISTQGVWYKRAPPHGEPAWLHALFFENDNAHPGDAPLVGGAGQAQWAAGAGASQQPAQPGRQLEQEALAAAPPTPLPGAPGSWGRLQQQQREQPEQPLPSLLLQPPPVVAASFAGTEPCRRQRQVVAACRGVTARQVRARPLWPLDPRRDDPSMAAMLLTLSGA